MEDPAREENLRAASTRGLAFSGVQYGLNRVLSLVGFALFARLLDPHAYGLASLAYVFMQLFAAVAAGGFGKAVAQREHLDSDFLNTSFWVSSATGFALTLLMCALAYPLAAAFQQPQLAPVLLVSSITFVAIGIASTPNALLQRELRFKTMATINVVANIGATLIGIAFAFAHFGVWALVVQATLVPIANGAGVWWAARFLPTGRPVTELLRPVYTASNPFLGYALLDFLSQNGDNFLVGAVLGPVELGIYAVAYRMIFVIIDVLANSVRVVALPAFARIQSDRARLRRSYTDALAISASVAIPCFLFVLVAAPDLVRGVFGDKWVPCVPIVRVLSAYGALEAVMIVNLVFLQAIGGARTVFRLTAFGTAVQIAAFAAAVHFGLTWVAAAYVLRSYLLAPVTLRAAAARIGLPTLRPLVVILWPALCGGLMALAMWMVSHAMHGGSSYARLAAMAAAAVATYFALMALLARGHLAQLKRVAHDVLVRAA